jgi:chromosome partitioning protein
MARILAFCGQKGGIGKTTLAYNVAAELARRKQRTLVVDADPQASLTRISGAAIGTETLATVIGQNTPGTGNTAAAIVPVSDNLDLLPSETLLAQSELGLVLRLNRERQLSAALRKVRDAYDYVVIDSPPSLGLITINVLLTAQHIVVPTLLESESVAGVRLFLQTLRETAEVYAEETARLLGVTATMVDLWKGNEPRLLASRELLNSLREDGIMFDAMIPRCASIPESMLLRRSLHDYKPDGRAAKAIDALTTEILQRINYND